MTVQERVQQKLAEYTQRGVILPETRLQSVVLDGIPYLDVYAYMPKDLFKVREQRHTIYETLENLGDQTLHVIAHIYRR